MRELVKNLAFDLDGVLADFYRAALMNILVWHPDPVRVVQYDLVDNCYPDIHSLFGAEAAIPEIYAALSPIDDSLFHLVRILEQKIYTGVYITSRPKNESVIEITKQWLREYGFPDLPLYFTDSKGQMCRELGIDIMVEDTPQQAETIVTDSPDTRVLLLRHIYNRTYKPNNKEIKLVASWADVMFNIYFPRDF